MESLPDLDQGPEVFETSDVESVENLGATEDIPSEDIENNHFNITSAQNKFEENTLVGQVDLVDFSGSLGAESSGKNSYHTRKWTETKNQRLARIQKELEEIQGEDDEEIAQVEALRGILEASVAQRGQNGYYYEKMHDTFVQLEKALGSELAQAVSPSGSDTKSDSKGDIMSHKGEQRKLEYSSVLELESRLTDLETAIGTNLGGSPAANLRVHLRDLDRKVNVLYNPEHELGAIKETVSSLNSDLETLAKNRRMAQLALPETARAPLARDSPSPSVSMGSTGFEKKVDSVYSKLEEIDSMKARLPAVITRLRTLHETHSDLAGAVSTVGEFDNMMATLKRDLDGWNTNLNTVKSAFSAHAEAFEQKSQRIEAELSQMEARVEALL